MKKRPQLAQPIPAAARTPAQRAADLARHARKCAICNHPQREEIESEFLHWEDPHHIVYDFKLPSRSCVYRHADATGLALQRRLGLRGVAERVIERVDDATITADAVLRAMRIYAHIAADGQWIEPPKVSIVEHRHSFANSPSPHALAVTRVEELALPAPPLTPPPVEGQPAKQAGSNGDLSSVGQRPKLPPSPQKDQPAPRESSPIGEILIGTGNSSRGEPND